jgi:hypothetical protein
MIRDCSLNLKYDNSMMQHVTDMARAVHYGAQIIGLQEVQTSLVRQSVHVFLTNHPHFDVVGLETECPILWHRGMLTITPGTYNRITTAVAEAGVNPERVITGARFSDVTGRTFSYYNTHIEQQFTASYKNDSHYADRLDKAKSGFDAIRNLLDGHNGVVRVGGDFNITLLNKNRTWFPGVDFPKLAKWDVYQGEDHIGWGPNVTLKNARGITCNSDHKMRLVDVSF